MSKVVERLICTQLSKFLENEGILPDIQSGFRGGFGTATALAHVSDDIVAASDVGMCSALVLLDFSRAFDCLNIELLLEKLSYYGISDESRQLFQSFLSNRSQFVEIESEHGELLRSPSNKQGNTSGFYFKSDSFHSFHFRSSKTFQALQTAFLRG
ncbi:unnamed protein product [Arctia plantaginis]|uniref:Reverse transcriptase domain-containing protein n=1 Tax=Arctia plantaginis TaxID=874455 RepID=A0A8S0Z398_ARCPL|nr:unnamed protein product [Arctia plantaginis]